jgi:iron complex outermembrane receptor protein
MTFMEARVTLRGVGRRGERKGWSRFARHLRVAVTAACLAAGATGTALAQPASGGSGEPPPEVRETVVVSATVAPDSLASLGRAVTLLTRDDIARLPVSSVADVLRLLASVEVRSRGERGVQSDFSIRGASFGQALVLVDGVRLNDAQSGHHNGDIPVSVADIERVEVLLGGGSSLHGADAFGGTVNVITRAAAPRFFADVAAGQHDLLQAAGSAGFTQGQASHRVTGELDHSSGFMPSRDYDVRMARYQGQFDATTRASVAYLDKEFGANGYYGPAPSREWTDQFLVTAERRFEAGRSQGSIDGSYRTHGDRFVYDVRNPALSQSTHRTHAFAVRGRWHAALSPGSTLSVGGEGGRDDIDSTNLGDRAFSRGSVLAELRQQIGDRVVLYPGLRVDAYSRFGTAVSPSASVSGWVSPHVKWRGSAGRVFRVPTFTELYYRDPNHEALGELDPERAWTGDAGVDTYAGSWSASATVFGRRESDVIDWVRASAADRWRTTNIREVRTAGVELSIRRALGRSSAASLQYTGLSSTAESLDLLSKYVLDYAPHSLTAAASGAWRAVSAGSRLEWRRRADGRQYCVVDLRVARTMGRAEVYADLANAFDTSYQEIRGVDMPGRWFKMGLRVR